MSSFRFMATESIKGQSNVRLFTVGDFEKDEPLPDLTPRPDSGGVVGSTRYAPGDRIGYDTAFWQWQHEDPGMHGFVDAVGFVLQAAAHFSNDVRSIGINDRGMPELQPQGLPPYPYEKGAVERPVLKDYCVMRQPRLAEIILLHRRHNASVSKARLQPLQVFTLPPTIDPDVMWFYQTGGEYVAVHKDPDKGTVARFILRSLHPAYSYMIFGMPGNSRGAEEIYETVRETGEVPPWYPK